MVSEIGDTGIGGRYALIGQLSCAARHRSHFRAWNTARR